MNTLRSAYDRILGQTPGQASGSGQTTGGRLAGFGQTLRTAIGDARAAATPENPFDWSQVRTAIQTAYPNWMPGGFRTAIGHRFADWRGQAPSTESRWQHPAGMRTEGEPPWRANLDTQQSASNGATGDQRAYATTGPTGPSYAQLQSQIKALSAALPNAPNMITPGKAVISTSGPELSPDLQAKVAAQMAQTQLLGLQAAQKAGASVLARGPDGMPTAYSLGRPTL